MEGVTVKRHPWERWGMMGTQDPLAELRTDDRCGGGSKTGMETDV